jgi:hypothetical protein
VGEGLAYLVREEPTLLVPQLCGLDAVELGPRHPPRPAQPQRRREQPQLIHTPTAPCYATITDSRTANETTTPSSTRHAGTTHT